MDVKSDKSKTNNKKLGMNGVDTHVRAVAIRQVVELLVDSEFVNVVDDDQLSDSSYCGAFHGTKSVKQEDGFPSANFPA